MDAEITNEAVPPAGGIEAASWQESQALLATRIGESLSGGDWAESTLFWSEVGGLTSVRLESLDATGARTARPVPETTESLGRALREAMADPDKGAWFSMTLTLAADGTYTSRFNFDRRVFDNPASPFTAGPAGAVPDDAAYERDLERFPRLPHYIPVWLRAGTVSLPAIYEPLRDSWGWPGVFESVRRQTLSATATAALPDRPEPAQVDDLGQQVLTAVVADVLEPHRVATLLRLHAEAVERRLLPDVPGVDQLDGERTLVEARAASTPELLAVEAGVYGIVGDVVRSHLDERLRR